MLTCEAQMRLKQISLMLCHPHLRVSSDPTEHSRSCSRRCRFSSLCKNDKPFDESTHLSKTQSRFSHRKEASGASANARGNLKKWKSLDGGIVRNGRGKLQKVGNKAGGENKRGVLPVNIISIGSRRRKQPNRGMKRKRN